MYPEEDIRKILNTAVAHGGDFADLYVSRSYTGSISAEEKKIHRFYRGFDEGAGIRVMKGDFSAYFYTNDVSLPSLLALAARAGESIGSDACCEPFGWQQREFLENDHEAFDLERIGEIIRFVNNEAWQISDKIQQISIAYGDNRKDVLMASTAGTLVRQQGMRKRFFVQIIAAEKGDGLEGDSVSKGLSVYKDQKGKLVASEKITVIDDATLPHHYGSFAFDDEGQKGRRNVLIENGILKDYMYDIRSARRVGTASTGNGRRESYCYAPQVRMSNTFIAPGQDDPASVIADIKKGFFVKKMGGGQVNTISGDFVFEVSEGYLIENGELTDAVKNASLIGNGPKTLSSVFAVGNDLGFAIGTCGKGGQSVPVGDAQPTIGISELVVGGKG